FVLPAWGWRPMFWIGALPALLALYITTRVPESEAWKQHRAGSMGEVLRTVAGQWKRFAYLVVLMTFMMFLSHGTQDLYPDFLKEVHRLRPALVANIAMIYTAGAVLGAIIFGHLSQVLGRRKGMMCALALSLAIIPFWAFGWSIPLLIAAAVLMQMGVQGAWGLIPGFAYQLGILFAAPTNNVEFALRGRFGYQWALASFEVVTIVALAALLWRGAEAHGKSFVNPV